MPGIIQTVVKHGAQKIARALGNNSALGRAQDSVAGGNNHVDVHSNNDAIVGNSSSASVLMRARHMSGAAKETAADIQSQATVTKDIVLNVQLEDDDLTVQLRPHPPRRGVSAERTHGRYVG